MSQTKTLRQKGCQIDYLIQTQHGTLFIIEIKFSKNPIGLSVVDEVETKINRLRYPKGFSIRPVLVHVSTTNESLLESEFFHYIIDFAEAFS